MRTAGEQHDEAIRRALLAQTIEEQEAAMKALAEASRRVFEEAAERAASPSVTVLSFD